MNDDVRFAEIELVQQHIIDALVRTNPPTTLSEKEQDNLLAQACSEACGILDRWVEELHLERAPAEQARADR